MNKCIWNLFCFLLLFSATPPLNLPSFCQVNVGSNVGTKTLNSSVSRERTCLFSVLPPADGAGELESSGLCFQRASEVTGSLTWSQTVVQWMLAPWWPVAEMPCPGCWSDSCHRKSLTG